MADSKVPLDTVIKHLTDTLSQHDSAIRKLEESVESVRSHIDTRITTMREDHKQDLQSLELSLTNLISSKETVWTQVSDNIQSLNIGLQQLKTLFTNHITTQSPSSDSPAPANVPPTVHTPVHNVPPPFVNTSLSTCYTLPPPTTQNPTTLVLPPSTSHPIFTGKSTERPRQFLLRVEEYTRTVNNWSRSTLLRGISQFLKDDALDWYCQLHHTESVPTDWDQFVTIFLAQFQSPLRMAQQEQTWLACKQQENESINQFVVRLRSLWMEHKPEETQSDFIKHLFCKMRPDMLNLMNFSRTSSLNSIISEAQKVEEILFLRSKEQQQLDLVKTDRTNTTHISSTSINAYTRTRPRISAPLPLIQSSASQPSSRPTITCWRCYETGHYSTECPLNNVDSASSTPARTTNASYSSQPLPPRTKNS